MGVQTISTSRPRPVAKWATPVYPVAANERSASSAPAAAGTRPSGDEPGVLASSPDGYRLTARFAESGGLSMIDFSLTSEIVALRDRVAAFVRDEVIPLEPEVDEHDGLPPDRLRHLRDRARDLGIYAPHVGRGWGRLGLGMRDMAVVFEAAGRTLSGPHALNWAAPD